MDDLIRSARRLRDKLLRDPHRPTYHFVAPEGTAMPFDPNGCLYWRGRYHLFYIFQDQDLPHGGHCWGHASSADLLHWRHHPTALAPMPGDPDIGIFSGNGFINKHGVPTLMYFGIEAGICIATSEDDNLDHWTKHPANPVIPIAREGDAGFGVYNVFDPHGWVEGDTYYTILGGKVLPGGDYDTVFLFKSQDMLSWEYVRPFYQPKPEWTGPEEDCACPDFFKLGDRHVLLCISHPRGARYYLGRYENETFHPEEHHRMNWPGGTCFAPESVLDEDGRRIFWTWVLGRRSPEASAASGWSGVMSLPRVMSVGEDGKVHIEPVEELTSLWHNPRVLEDLRLADGQEMLLQTISGDALCLEVVADVPESGEFSLVLRRSPDAEEQTVISYNYTSGLLSIDFSRSTLDETVHYSQYIFVGGIDNPEVSVQRAPLRLVPDEPLSLRIYLDRSILEVFANGRQCMTQRIYPTRPDSVGVAVSSTGGSSWVYHLAAYDVAPTMAW